MSLIQYSTKHLFFCVEHDALLQKSHYEAIGMDFYIIQIY